MADNGFEVQIKQKATEYITKMRENPTLTPIEKGTMTQWMIHFVENAVLAVYAETQRQHKKQIEELLAKHDITFAYHGCEAWLGELKRLEGLEHG